MENNDDLKKLIKTKIAISKFNEENSKKNSLKTLDECKKLCYNGIEIGLSIIKEDSYHTKEV